MTPDTLSGETFFSGSVNNGPEIEYRMMRGYLDTVGGVTTVTVSGLPASSGGYTVYVYAEGDNGSGTRTGAYKVSGAGITTTSVNLSQVGSADFNGTFTQANNSVGNYVVCSIAASGFTITATPSSATDNIPRAPVNAIQIVPAGVSRYVANGDGTLTDTLTGLMWEITTSTCSGEITCYTNQYAWSTSASNYIAPAGSLFTTFLATLNGGEYYNPADMLDESAGAFVGSCFANHCDWRIPNIQELRSILLAPFPCGTSPCIDPAFGPTQAYLYWSSSSLAGDPHIAWYVNFTVGDVDNAGKTLSTYARAVRTTR